MVILLLIKEVGMSGHVIMAGLKEENKEVFIQLRHIMASVEIPNTGCNFVCLSDTEQTLKETYP